MGHPVITGPKTKPRKVLKILRHNCRVNESILLRSGEKTRSVDGKIDEGDEKEEKEEAAVRMLKTFSGMAS